MNLEKTLRAALDFTERLESGLETGDLELCQDLMELRGSSMLAFEQAHQGSLLQEQAQCSELIAELKRADAQLQKKYGLALEQSAGDVRQSLMSGSGSPSGAYNTAPSPSCLDRRA